MIWEVILPVGGVRSTYIGASSAVCVLPTKSIALTQSFLLYCSEVITIVHDVHVNGIVNNASARLEQSVVRETKVYQTLATPYLSVTVTVTIQVITGFSRVPVA